MELLSNYLFLLSCLQFFVCYQTTAVFDDIREGNDVEPAEDYSELSTTTESYFSDMPERISIVYIEAESLQKIDNKGERMMGVSDEKCDNGKVKKSII